MFSSFYWSQQAHTRTYLHQQIQMLLYGSPLPPFLQAVSSCFLRVHYLNQIIGLVIHLGEPKIQVCCLRCMHMLHTLRIWQQWDRNMFYLLYFYHGEYSVGTLYYLNQRQHHTTRLVSITMSSSCAFNLVQVCVLTFLIVVAVHDDVCKKIYCYMNKPSAGQFYLLWIFAMSAAYSCGVCFLSRLVLSFASTVACAKILWFSLLWSTYCF